MNYFDDFQLSGVVKKVESEDKAIITDYFGNL